jgi:hypothetical protein
LEVPWQRRGKRIRENQDGSLVKIEVPSDKYDAALDAMRARINKGEIPGVTDPKDAEKIVKKGLFTSGPYVES